MAGCQWVAIGGFGGGVLICFMAFLFNVAAYSGDGIVSVGRL